MLVLLMIVNHIAGQVTHTHSAHSHVWCTF